jgi:mono/diheme cytochrome c family protein
MRKVIISVCLLILVIAISYFVETRRSHYSNDPVTIAEGKATFGAYCASCHGLDEEVIGPKLGGITNALSERSLLAFISNPEKVIQSGDSRAVSQHNEFKLVMPSFDYLGADKIGSILAYINNETRLRNLKAVSVDPKTGAAKKRLLPAVKRSSISPVPPATRPIKAWRPFGPILPGTGPCS